MVQHKELEKLEVDLNRKRIEKECKTTKESKRKKDKRKNVQVHDISSDSGLKNWFDLGKGSEQSVNEF